MAAFFVVKCLENENIQIVDEKYRNSLDTFSQKGLLLQQKIVTCNSAFYFYRSEFDRFTPVIEFDNGDFIFCQGTPIYKKETALTALNRIYQDFESCFDFTTEIRGHFTIILKKRGKVFFFNDYAGLTHIYKDHRDMIFSSSFVAMTKAVSHKSISVQEVYEYILEGVMYGNKTFFNEISIVDRENVIELSADTVYHKRTFKKHFLGLTSNYQTSVEAIADNLLGHYEELATNFGDSLNSGLTAGYDSRLNLSLLEKFDYNFRYEVGGAVDSPDVVIAKEIAIVEGVGVEHYERISPETLSVDKYLSHVKRQYHLNDGIGNAGIFDDGTDWKLKLEGASRGSVGLVGIGGEIYRNYWGLPDRKYSIRSFLRSRYDTFDSTEFSQAFDRNAYFDTLAEKVKTILGSSADILDRKQVEILYPDLRMRYWAGTEVARHSQFYPILLPFGDSQIIHQSFEVPIKWKLHGQLEADLIKHLNPEVAKIKSEYGYNFFDPIPAKYKVKTFVKENTPIWLRYALRPRKYKKDHKLKIADAQQFHPYYLQPNYLSKVFGSGRLLIEEYISLEQIIDPGILSRALTVELSLGNYF